MSDPTGLTDDERSLFNALGGLMQGNSKNWTGALMRATFDGEEVGVVVAVSTNTSGPVEVRPLALMLDESLMDRLEPPEGSISESDNEGSEESGQ